MSDGPFLSPSEQILHCIEKGITFQGISESTAQKYLESNNNYFKLRSFRKNYEKRTLSGKYINLDFSDLIDLACIDNRIRRIFLEMAISIEHFSKVHLLYTLQRENIDPYDIIDRYKSQLRSDSLRRLNDDLQKNSFSTYCGNLYRKYILDEDKRCPVWAFLEMISFGQYLHFYSYCESVLSDAEITDRLYLMRTVKDLRNACAHNNCIINELSAPYPNRPSQTMEKAVSLFLKTPSSRRRHLNHVVVYQMLTTLYTHQRICVSTGVHRHISDDLNGLKERFFRDKDYNLNNRIKSAFNVFIKAIDTWFRVL